MKKFVLPVLSLIALFIFTACSEKFKVAAPYKNITVVYGLLDIADTAHYIRIQKAFLDDTKSALVMAKEADSNFFSSLNVVLKRYNYNGYLLQTINLNRVDLTLEGYTKETGAFFNSPNYAYKFKDILDVSSVYRLVVKNSATGETDSADAPVIGNDSLTSFNIYLLDNPTIKDRQINFASTGDYNTVVIAGRYEPPADFSFQGYTTPVGLVQSVLRFQWVDSNVVTGAETHRYYDYDLGYNSLSSSAFRYTPKDIYLYNAIHVGMGPAPTNIVRLLDRCQLTVYLGTYDFNSYINAQSIQGTGLTGNEIQPVYTNVKGANVLGLFTARTYRTGLITINSDTIDSLQLSSLLSDCMIRGTVYH